MASGPTERVVRTGVEDIVLRVRDAEPLVYGAFVDCNMATAWVQDEYRIFPGKHGEDPVWGPADHLRMGSGPVPSSALTRSEPELVRLDLPPNAPAGSAGLHGAVWFESIHQDTRDPSGHTLYALYHNENYPQTLPWDEASGTGLRDHDWPPGLLGDGSVQAVPRIGVMRSTDAGASWDDRGILLEDGDDRMIRLPVNRNFCFPGGVGDPSAVACGDHLYVFFGEYAYPEAWSAGGWDAPTEAAAQCIGVARVPLEDLDEPTGRARRWDGVAFEALWDGAGAPIRSLQIDDADGGGPVSQGDRRYYWGPSVSWNEHLGVWVMLMGRVDGPFWVGDSVFVSINTEADLGAGDASQRWSTPVELLSRPGRTLWYPALQPTDEPDDVAGRRSGIRLGRRARLFVKDIPRGDLVSGQDRYGSDHLVELEREVQP
ncbi:hypothetical protein [Pseudactinotalea suaedae]|uniref:hypothetical protein n=1 Tax=Pseudactinotalea suaedae TaxID=1524924 RepID=UPI0012E328DE|nr:hypothetical protein [Pseudactinotalea suaedae]